MQTFRTYNRLYFKGKPTGKAFVFHKSLKAKSKVNATKIINKINRAANKLENKTAYRVKLVKVKKL